MTRIEWVYATRASRVAVLYGELPDGTPIDERRPVIQHHPVYRPEPPIGPNAVEDRPDPDELYYRHNPDERPEGWEDTERDQPEQ